MQKKDLIQMKGFKLAFAFILAFFVLVSFGYVVYADTVIDDFNDGVIDENLWVTYVGDCGSYIQESGGKLILYARSRYHPACSGEVYAYTNTSYFDLNKINKEVFNITIRITKIWNDDTGGTDSVYDELYINGYLVKHYPEHTWTTTPIIYIYEINKTAKKIKVFEDGSYLKTISYSEDYLYIKFRSVANYYAATASDSAEINIDYVTSEENITYFHISSNKNKVSLLNYNIPIDYKFIYENTSFTCYFNITQLSTNTSKIVTPNPQPTWQNGTTYINSNDLYDGNNSIVMICDNGNYNQTSHETLYIEKVDYFDYPTNYKAEVIETEKNNFNLTVEYDNTVIDDINAKLIYDGTTYIPEKISNGTHFVFSKDLYAPLISASSENKSFYWNLTITYLDGSVEYYATDSKNQTVYKLDLKKTTTSCPAGYSILYNFNNIVDEISEAGLTKSDFSYDAKFWLWVDNYDNRRSYIYTGNFPVIFCLPDITMNKTTVKSKIYVRHVNDTYVARNYLTCELFNESKNPTIYALDSTLYTKFYLTIYDQNQQPLENYPVVLKKYFASLNDYREVDGDITDNFGQAIIRAEEDRDYKLLTYDEQCNLINQQTLRLICKELPCEITLTLANISSPFEVLKEPEGFIYSWTWDKSNKKWIFEFEDTKDNVESVEIFVYKKNIATNDELIFSDISTANTGKFEINLSNYSRGSFKAEVFVTDKEGNEKKVYNSLDISEIKEKVGLEGLFFALLIIVSLALIGLWKPEVSAVLALVGIGFVWLLGFAQLSWIFIIAIAIVFIIIIVKSKTQSPPT